MGPLLLVTLPPFFFFSFIFFYQYREFSSLLLYQNLVSPHHELDTSIGITSLPSSWEKFDGYRHLTLRDMQQIEKIVRFHSNSYPVNDSKSETAAESELFGEYFDAYWSSYQNVKLLPFAEIINVVFTYMLENYGDELGADFLKGCELIVFKLIIKSWFQVEQGVENLPFGFSGEGFEKDREILKLGIRPLQKCMSSFEFNPIPTSFPGEARPVENAQRTITSFSLSQHHRRLRKKRHVKRRRIKYLYRLKFNTKREDQNVKVHMKNTQGKIKKVLQTKKRRSGKRKQKHNSHRLQRMIINSEQVNEIMIIEQKGDKHLLDGTLTRPQTRLKMEENQLLQQHEYFRSIHIAHLEDETSESDEEKEQTHLRELDMMSFFENDGEVSSSPKISDTNDDDDPMVKDPEKGKGNENIACLAFWFGYELLRNKCHDRLTPVENERLMYGLDTTLTTLISQYHYDPLGSSSTYKDIYLVIFQMETEQEFESSVTALHKIVDTNNKTNIRKPFTNTLLK